MPEEVVYDAWTPISFKRQLGGRSVSGAGAGFEPPTWTGEDNRRRLMAYAILRAYQDNAAREFMSSQDRGDIDNRREYGDAATVVNATLGALLGEEQTIAVQGAENAEEDEVDQETRDAVELQEWLQKWAKDERLQLKMIETERRAVGLGDGVYTLGWSDDKGRPRLRVFDPTFYFPVLDDGNEDDYPSKVHIAWELPPEPGDPTGKVKIRRITWEMGYVGEAGEPTGMLRRMLGRGEDLTEETRQYEWNEEPSNRTCFLSDGTWEVDRAARRVEDLTESDAVWAVDGAGLVHRRDLMIDFIPVVHVPNTVSLLEHFGRSVLSSVLQILDDIASADSDLAAASATTGHPPIALKDASVQRDKQGRAAISYRPGEILETGDGTLTVIDTSKSLDALMKYIEFLLRRLSVNSRIPEAVLGRIKPSEVPSGVALALSFGPLEQLVGEMRLVRSEKYPLLLKFAHRLAAAGQAKDVPGNFGLHAEVQFGSFLPQDQAAAVSAVTTLLSTKPRPAISMETAIVMLVEAGMPIRDAAKEVARIQERDFEGAAELLDALGDPALVAEYLGRENEFDAEAQAQREADAARSAAAEAARLAAEGSADEDFGPDGKPAAAQQ